MSRPASEWISTAVAAGVTAFLAAAALWLLLGRLGDDGGSTFAGWTAVAAGGVTVVAAAGLSLATARRGDESRT